MEERKSSKTVAIVVAIIVIALILISVFVKMTRNKQDDANLNNAKNNIVNGSKDIANDAIDGTKNIAGDVAEGAGDMADGVKDAAEDIKDGIIKAFNLNNKENVTISNDTKTNNSEKLKETKTLGNLTYSNATLIGKNTGATFTFELKNNSNSDFTKRKIVVRFADRNGKEIGNAEIEIPDLKKGEQKKIEKKIMADVANAYDYTVKY